MTRHGRSRLTKALGGLAVLGVLGCVLVPILVAGLVTVTGLGTGYLFLSGEELAAVALLHLAGLVAYVGYTRRDALAGRLEAVR